MYHHKHTYKAEAFYNENELSYYLLGAFITDGCVHQNRRVVSINSKDYDWLFDINQLISNDNLIKIRNSYPTLLVYNREIVKWLISNECVPKKSLIVKFPTVPEKYLPDFIRGMIDGDGSIILSTYKKSRTKQDGSIKNYEQLKIGCDFYSSSMDMIDGLSKILDMKEINFSISTKKPKEMNNQNGKKIISKHNCYTIHIRGKNAYKFMQWIYYPNHKISLLRKAKIAEAAINSYNKKLQSETKYPSKEELETLVWQMSITKLAKQIGVPYATLQGRINKLGIKKPEPKYWNKQYAK